MSIINSKKFKSGQTKILLFITGLMILLFSILWTLWWSNAKGKLQNIVTRSVAELKNNLSEFNDFFQPTYSEVLPMPVKAKKVSDDTMNEKNLVESEQFDSTYYFYLWDMFINEFGMYELDSLSIDSLVKIEMEKTKPETQPETINGAETFSLKKDELLYVTTLKPLPYKAENIKEQDSLDFSAIEDNLYTLEFWISPLNYQGIKTTGNLIIIYGISDFENIVLHFISRNNFALKIKSKMYSLKNDGQFHPFKELQFN